MIRKHVTLSMIAEACETSVGTVSRALNQKADVNAETKARISETSAKLGYRGRGKTVLPAASFCTFIGGSKIADDF